jgi:hypothetical protein
MTFRGKSSTVSLQPTNEENEIRAIPPSTISPVSGFQFGLESIVFTIGNSNTNGLFEYGDSNPRVIYGEFMQSTDENGNFFIQNRGTDTFPVPSTEHINSYRFVN